MKQIYAHIAAFLKDEEGASAIEYALIAALLALAISVGASTLGGQLNTTFVDLAERLKAAIPKP